MRQLKEGIQKEGDHLSENNEIRVNGGEKRKFVLRENGGLGGEAFWG